MRLNVALIYVGMTVILCALAYWVATATQSVLFVAAGIVLIAIGSNEGFRTQVPSINRPQGEQPSP